MGSSSKLLAKRFSCMYLIRLNWVFYDFEPDSESWICSQLNEEYVYVDDVIRFSSKFK